MNCVRYHDAAAIPSICPAPKFVIVALVAPKRHRNLDHAKGSKFPTRNVTGSGN